MSVQPVDNRILAAGETFVGAPLVAYCIGSGNLVGAASASLLMGAALLHLSVSPRVNAIGTLLTSVGAVGLTFAAPEIFSGPLYQIPRYAVEIAAGAATLYALRDLPHHRNG